MLSIGENIKRIREDAGIPQARLAEDIGITASMLCQIERGTKIPSMILGVQIAEALQCDIKSLIKESA